jgi:hypothetical protein
MTSSLLNPFSFEGCDAVRELRWGTIPEIAQFGTLDLDQAVQVVTRDTLVGGLVRALLHLRRRGC